MNKILIILSFIAWGLGCLILGYFIGSYYGWQDGYYYGVKSSYYKINNVVIGGAGNDKRVRIWEGE